MFLKLHNCLCIAPSYVMCIVTVIHAFRKGTCLQYQASMQVAISDFLLTQRVIPSTVYAMIGFAIKKNISKTSLQ